MAERKRIENSATFPKWAPAEVIDYLHEYELQLKGYNLEDPRRRCPLLISTLLNAENMKCVWEALGASKKPMAPLIFAAAACHGFLGPQYEEGLTQAEHKAFLKKVQRLSVELSNTLRGYYLDGTLISHLVFPIETRTSSTCADVYAERPGQPHWSRFSEILDSVASAAPYLCKVSAGKRTHGDYACRAYFVRHLTGFFREYLGKPERSLVAAATAAAFTLSDFDPRQVRKLAP